MSNLLKNTLTALSLASKLVYDHLEVLERDINLYAGGVWVCVMKVIYEQKQLQQDINDLFDKTYFGRVHEDCALTMCVSLLERANFNFHPRDFEVEVEEEEEEEEDDDYDYDDCTCSSCEEEAQL